MKVIIRTDSSFNIGTGHVVRSLALAKQLREQGLTVSFACRLLDGNIINLIEEKQFKVIKLSTPSAPIISDKIYDIWRGVTEEFEIEEFSKVIIAEKPEWIIVDHYSLSSNWETKVKNLGSKLFVIDDLYRNHICDAFLDQNTLKLASKYQELTPVSSKLFLGPKYALLSAGFLALTPPERKFSKVSRILAFFGGSDLTGETLKLMNTLYGKSLDYEFDIVVGKINRSIDKISELCKKDTRFTLHIQTPFMANLMEKADIFIGAGGTTNWEKCYMGLPSICITTAENQVQIAKDLDEMNIHKYLGHWDTLSGDEILKALEEIADNQRLRTLYSANSYNLGVGSLTSSIWELFKS